MKKSLALLLCLWTLTSFAQHPISIHWEQLRYFDSIEQKNPKISWINFWKSHKITPNYSSPNYTLNYLVFGWHPYWENGLEQNYQWNLISDLAYFCYETDPQTGKALSYHQWFSAKVISLAQKHNVNVFLTCTLFSEHQTFFGSTLAQDTLIHNLIFAVKYRHAQGINIDFENIPSSVRNQFTSFIQKLYYQINQQNYPIKISIALPAVDWNKVFDIPTLKKYVDLFIIMGYNYYYSKSSQAGPTGQLYTLSTVPWNEIKSVLYYLNQGIPKNKLLLGLPYYGFKWQTSSNKIPSNTLSSGKTVLIKYYLDKPLKLNYKSKSQYLISNINGSWYQTWIDADSALAFKLQVIRHLNIAGIGIWALGYDDGSTKLWNTINAFLTSQYHDPISDTLFDLGGPLNNYYNDENYSFSLSLPYKPVKITFKYIHLAPFDSLVISWQNHKKIFFQTQSQNISITIPSNSFSIHVHTDNSQTDKGWILSYSKTQNALYTVYPSPAKNFIKIKNIKNGLLYIILSPDGKILKQGFYNDYINVSNLPPGLYLVTFPYHNITAKFIKL